MKYITEEENEAGKGYTVEALPNGYAVVKQSGPSAVATYPRTDRGLADAIVRACECELGYKLSDGQKRDLILDNTDATRADVEALFPRNPLEQRLRHHVTGAIERGEAIAITEQRAPLPPARTPLDREKDYSVVASNEANGFDVWHVASVRRISWHVDERAAKQARKRYAQADARRAARGGV